MKDRGMKKLMMLTMAAILSAALPLAAETETVNGITWAYTVANGVASVGLGSYYSPAVPASTSGAITIPSKLGGYPVTSIGYSAFENGMGRIFDCAPYLKDKYRASLANSTFFRQVRVDCGMLCRPNDIDIDPEEIWDDCAMENREA